MNPFVQRFGPPIVVFGAALYLGWPPSAPMDLGQDVVKARAVRWKPSDLQSVTSKTTGVDPFRAVLVAGAEMEVEPETGKLVTPISVGPPPESIKQGLNVSGIAIMGRDHWAVINGKPRVQGDIVFTADANRYACEIVSVKPDRVIVRCEETTVGVHPRRIGSKPPTAAANPKPSDTAPQQPAATPEQQPPPPAPSITQ